MFELRKEVFEEITRTQNFDRWISAPVKRYEHLLISHSGGFDSFATTLLGLRYARRVTLVHFNYQQKHGVERIFRDLQYKLLKTYIYELKQQYDSSDQQHNIPEIDKLDIDISWLGEIARKAGSALTIDSATDVPNEEYDPHREPITTVPNRNGIFAELMLTHLLANYELNHNSANTTLHQKIDPIRLAIGLGIHKSPYIDTRYKYWLGFSLKIKSYRSIGLDIELFTPFIAQQKRDVAKVLLLMTRLVQQSDIARKILLNRKQICEQLKHICSYLRTRQDSTIIKCSNPEDDIRPPQFCEQSDNNSQLFLWDLTYSCYRGYCCYHCNSCATCRERLDAIHYALKEYSGIET